MKALRGLRTWSRLLRRKCSGRPGSDSGLSGPCSVKMLIWGGWLWVGKERGTQGKPGVCFSPGQSSGHPQALGCGHLPASPRAGCPCARTALQGHPALGGARGQDAHTQVVSSSTGGVWCGAFLGPPGLMEEGDCQPRGLWISGGRGEDPSEGSYPAIWLSFLSQFAPQILGCFKEF